MTSSPIWIGLAIAASPCAGQSAADADAAQMIERAKTYYGVDGAGQDCGVQQPSDGDIVICARRKPPPRLELQDTSARPDMKMIALGAPPTGHGGGGVTMRGCFLQRCPKDLYFFDIAALPEAPPDSDADKISKGLMRAH